MIERTHIITLSSKNFILKIESSKKKYLPHWLEQRFHIIWILDHQLELGAAFFLNWNKNQSYMKHSFSLITKGQHFKKKQIKLLRNHFHTSVPDVYIFYLHDFDRVVVTNFSTLCAHKGHSFNLPRHEYTISIYAEKMNARIDKANLLWINQRFTI